MGEPYARLAASVLTGCLSCGSSRLDHRVDPEGARRIFRATQAPSAPVTIRIEARKPSVCQAKVDAGFAA